MKEINSKYFLKKKLFVISGNLTPELEDEILPDSFEIEFDDLSEELKRNSYNINI